MRPVDLIVKKRDGGVLAPEEIRLLVRDYVGGAIPDYQFAALLMAVFFRGMSAQETAALTEEMIRSGDVLDLSGIKRPLVDKHSTGGVGDKVSLILAPLAASCGLTVPMMSGRSLGHTGGTLDKLESIPGYRTDLPADRFRRALSEVGFAMIGQSASVVPADRLMYALRDVTGTVESIPLITASILSKKFAEGAESLVFDVKCGSGAFMKKRDVARELGNSLVAAARGLGRDAAAVLTDMDQPLGRKVGNFLEIEETVDALRGGGPADLREVTLRLAAWMLVLGGLAPDVKSAERIAGGKLDDGSAWKRFLANVEFQGGDLSVVEDPARGPHARIRRDVPAASDGFVRRIDAHAVGIASVILGAGRSRKEDAVLPGVGIELLAVQGEAVRTGQAVAAVLGEDEAKVEEACRMVAGAYVFCPQREAPASRILEEISG